MKARQSTVTVGLKTNNAEASNYDYAKQIGSAMLDVAFQHTGVPTEGDYIRWHFAGCQYTISYNGYGGTNYLTFSFDITYYTTASQEAQMDIAVANLLASLNTKGSNYRKVCAVYDWICQNVTYSYSSPDSSNNMLQFSAYSALIYRSAVCQGYSSLLYRLALELGIDCRLISGFGNSSRHGWNIIKLDNAYYNLDSTWDAGQDSYSYFLKCSNNFPGHYRDAEFATEAFYTAYPMGQMDYTPLPDIENGWLQIGDTWYFYLDYCRQTGWQEVNRSWYFFDNGGAMQTGWQKISGTWYYFDNSGAMQTGWVKDGGKWYYMNTSGAIQTGWIKPGSSWYYLDPSGVMQTGWVKDGNSWYYLNASGVMQTGWVSAGGKWYYCNGSGVMQTGWINRAGTWYYFNTSGVMVTGTQVINGNTYIFNASGAWIR